MKPYYHALSSAKKYGGVWEDYFDIHQFMDSSKAHVADHRHRALLHSSFGCFIVEEVFGYVRANSDGKMYNTRDIAEQHCIEDLGRIPSVQDYFESFKVQTWMGGPPKRNKQEFQSKNKDEQLLDRALSDMKSARKEFNDKTNLYNEVID